MSAVDDHRDHPLGEPSDILASQFFDAQSEDAPERRLVVAILEDAVRCGAALASVRARSPRRPPPLSRPPGRHSYGSMRMRLSMARIPRACPMARRIACSSAHDRTFPVSDTTPSLILTPMAPAS